LRVYSDDMHHKSLSRAEKKGYSLPVTPSQSMIYILPAIFVVLLPVFVRLYTGHDALLGGAVQRPLCVQQRA